MRRRREAAYAHGGVVHGWDTTAVGAAATVERELLYARCRLMPLWHELEEENVTRTEQRGPKAEVACVRGRGRLCTNHGQGRIRGRRLSRMGSSTGPMNRVKKKEKKREIDKLRLDNRNLISHVVEKIISNLLKHLPQYLKTLLVIINIIYPIMDYR